MKYLIKATICFTLFTAINQNYVSAQVIFSENFDNGIPSTFTIIDNDGLTPHSSMTPFFTDAWVPLANISPDTVAASTSYYSSPGTSDDWLITPDITVSSGSELLWKARAVDADFPDGYQVWVTTTGATVSDFLNNGTMVYSVVAESATLTNRTVNLNTFGFTNQTIYIAFRNNSTDMFVLGIDDVTVRHLSDFDVALDSAYISPYTMLPKEHLFPLSFTARIRNTGINSVTNVNATANIYYGSLSNLVSTISSNTQTSLNSGGVMILNSQSTFLPSDTGKYFFQFIVSIAESDGYSINDTILSQFRVDQNLFAKDYSLFADSTYGTIQSIGAGSGNSGVFGQNFTLQRNGALDSISASFALLKIGDTLRYEVYTTSGGIPDSLIAQTDDHIVTAADTGDTFVTLSFSNGPLGLIAGTYYIAAREFHSSSNVGLHLSREIYTPNNTWININDVGFFTLESQGFLGCFLIRPRFTDAPAQVGSIRGRVYLDENMNCIFDSTEKTIHQAIIKTNPSAFYASIQPDGSYSLALDTGTYTIEQFIPQKAGQLLIQTCPLSPPTYTVSLSTYTDTTGFDFAVEGVLCPVTTVSASINRTRPCRITTAMITIKNDGFAEATNLDVKVALPEELTIVSASVPYTYDVDSNVVFSIDTLNPEMQKNIALSLAVKCDVSITGHTLCLKAWATPGNDCAYVLDSTYGIWDQSHIQIGTPECVFRPHKVRFVIFNAGTGDMADSAEYRIYSNNQLAHTANYKLMAGDSLTVQVPALGQAFHLQVDQRPHHPGDSMAIAFIEACGSDTFGNVSLGYITTMPFDENAWEKDVECVTVTNAYDPNDKAVSPEGILANNYVKPASRLEYKVRFQNTGTDTAFKVVVVDTLSGLLDIRTISFDGASHHYELEVYGKGQPVLYFIFDDIYLPDSNVNEPASHGFVKFSIAPYDTLPEGTVVENFADIYFDFNPPVRTNTEWVTLKDTTLTAPTVDVQECEDNSKPILSVLPMDTTICSGNSFTVTTSGTATEFYWTATEPIDDSLSANPLLSPATSTVYYLSAFVDSLCYDAQAAVTVTVNTLWDDIRCSPVKGLSPREIGLVRYATLTTVQPFIPKDVIFSVQKASDEQLTALEESVIEESQPNISAWIQGNKLMLKADIGGSVSCRLQLFSVLGQEVYSEDVVISRGLNSYPVSQRLSLGMYMVTIENRDIQEVQKIIVAGR